MPDYKALAIQCVDNMGDIFYDHDPDAGETDPREIAIAAVEKALQATTTDPHKNQPFGGSHAPDCPYRLKGECNCWRSDPAQNQE